MTEIQLRCVKLLKLLTIFLIIVVVLSFILKLDLIENEQLLKSPTKAKIIQTPPVTIRNVHQSRSPLPSKLILFWNNLYDDPFWGFKKQEFSENDLKTLGCKYQNCVFKFNRTNDQNISDFDMLIFHTSESHPRSIPNVRYSYQIYVMATQESAGYPPNNLRKEIDFYNLTMTYRMDSDIPWYYAYVKDKSTNRTVAPSYFPNWRKFDQHFNNSELVEIVKRKNLTIAWFVSNCNAVSRRDNLAKRIGKKLQVDIYGSCGPLKCQKNSNMCDQMLNSTYKFYFAFENSLCADYVTEKVFDKMNKFIIPIVYNGATMNKFLPPNSYIDVEDFATVDDFLSHLDLLIRNPEEYIKYFWWKRYYDVISDVRPDLCKICEKVNEVQHQKMQKSYENIYKWVYENSCRTSLINF